MRHYKLKRNKGILESKLEQKGIYAEDIMYICGISMTAAYDRVKEKVDFKAKEVKKLKDHFNLPVEEAWQLFIERD